MRVGGGGGLGGFYKNNGPVVSHAVLVDSFRAGRHGLDGDPSADPSKGAIGGTITPSTEQEGGVFLISRGDGKRFWLENTVNPAVNPAHPVTMDFCKGFRTNSVEISAGLETLDTLTLLKMRDHVNDTFFGLFNVTRDMQNLIPLDFMHEYDGIFIDRKQFSTWIEANQHLLDRDPGVYSFDGATEEEKDFLRRFGGTIRAQDQEAPIGPVLEAHFSHGSVMRSMNIAPGLDLMSDKELGVLYERAQGKGASIFKRFNPLMSLDEHFDILAKAIHPHFRSGTLGKSDLIAWVEENRPSVATSIKQGFPSDDLSPVFPAPEPRAQKTLDMPAP